MSYEGITNYDSLTDFDKTSIGYLPRTCKEIISAMVEDLDAGISAETEVYGENIGSISIRHMIVAVNTTKDYTSIGRTMNSTNMHYTNELSKFKIEAETYVDLKEKDDPEVPMISDRDNNHKVIKWGPIFRNCLCRTYGTTGKLLYVLRETSAVPSEIEDPLENNDYFGSGSIHDELVTHLPHTRPIFNHDNATVFMKIEKSSRGTTIKSTVNFFSYQEWTCGISNNHGESYQ